MNNQPVAPFRLHPWAKRPSKRRKSTGRRRVPTKNQTLALEHCCHELKKYGQQLIVLAEEVPAYHVRTSLQVLEWLGEKARHVLEKTGPIP